MPSRAAAPLARPTSAACQPPGGMLVMSSLTPSMVAAQGSDIGSAYCASARAAPTTVVAPGATISPGEFAGTSTQRPGLYMIAAGEAARAAAAASSNASSRRYLIAAALPWRRGITGQKTQHYQRKAPLNCSPRTARSQAATAGQEYFRFS